MNDIIWWLSTALVVSVLFNLVIFGFFIYVSGIKKGLDNDKK